MSYFTITRFFVVVNKENQLTITKKEVNKHAPINRVLDRVGFFGYDFVIIDGIQYIVNYEQSESNTTKTKLLISKTLKGEGKLVDITEDDLKRVYVILKKYMGIDY
jgi:hypothetical protein